AGCAAAGQPEDREIIRFGAATGKNQLMWFGAEQISQPVARVINGCTRFASRRMDTRRVAEVVVEERQHRLPRGAAQRSGGVVVEVNYRSNTRSGLCTLPLPLLHHVQLSFFAIDDRCSWH